MKKLLRHRIGCLTPGRQTNSTRKLGAWYWRMMVKGGDYVEKGLARYEEQVRKTKEYALKRLAKELGRQLVPVPATT